MSDPISCAAACKRSVPDEDTALDQSWSSLPITGRWRCPHCERELAAVNQPRRSSAPSITDADVPY